MLRLLLINALVIMLYMVAWFIVARSRNRLDTVDNAWGGGYFVLAWSTFAQQPSWLTLLIAGLVTIWAARLTSHIARRNSQRPEDPRYVAISEKWQGNLWLRAFFSIYLLQGGLIWAIGLPISLAGQSLSENASLYIVAGLIVWIVGFTFESIGDRQLKNYLASKPTKNQVLDTGLWRYSRHPNYFGEIFLWYGIGIMACSTGNLLSLIGPTILYITIRYFSGVPPIENKRCNNTAYQAYKARTSVLIPLPPRAARLG